MIRFCELQKASNNTMKKCYLLLRWPCLLQDVLQQTFTVQNKPAVATKETITPSFLCWNCRRKLSMQPKFVAAQKMLLNTNPANIRCKWIARFYYFRVFILRWKRVCIAHNNCTSCPSTGNSICNSLINILGFLPVVFCIVISLSEVK